MISVGYLRVRMGEGKHVRRLLTVTMGEGSRRKYLVSDGEKEEEDIVGW